MDVKKIIAKFNKILTHREKKVGIMKSHPPRKASEMKTISYASPTSQVTKLAADLKAGGYEVSYDRAGGTLVAKMDGVDVVRALKMRSTWAIRVDERVVQIG